MGGSFVIQSSPMIRKNRKTSGVRSARKESSRSAMRKSAAVHPTRNNNNVRSSLASAIGN